MLANQSRRRQQHQACEAWPGVFSLPAAPTLPAKGLRKRSLAMLATTAVLKSCRIAGDGSSSSRIYLMNSNHMPRWVSGLHRRRKSVSIALPLMLLAGPPTYIASYPAGSSLLQRWDLR